MKLEYLVIFCTCLSQKCILVSPRVYCNACNVWYSGSSFDPFRLSFYLLCRPSQSIRQISSPNISPSRYKGSDQFQDQPLNLHKKGKYINNHYITKGIRKVLDKFWRKKVILLTERSFWPIISILYWYDNTFFKSLDADTSTKSPPNVSPSNIKSAK